MNPAVSAIMMWRDTIGGGAGKGPPRDHQGPEGAGGAPVLANRIKKGGGKGGAGGKEEAMAHPKAPKKSLLAKQAEAATPVRSLTGPPTTMDMELPASGVAEAKISRTANDIYKIMEQIEKLVIALPHVMHKHQ